MNAIDRALAPAPALRLISGNHACALGAVAAGCRFFAGYPITPSSEVAERLSRLLPQVDGVFVQMEDEIASIAAVIGASMGGVKALTATSGPGFSLKQENIGYAAGAEIPCVIVNVMRGGPSTGMPTRPAQGDIMQARWGSHGDYPIIVLAPASVREIYDETMRAFDLAESLRTPVVVLYDQVIAQLTETVDLADTKELAHAERKWASGPREAYRICLALADLRSGKLVSKGLAFALPDGVDPTPLAFFRDAPAWSEDPATEGYVKTCQGTKAGDPINPLYLDRIIAAALVAEAIDAYDAGHYQDALDLYSNALATPAGNQFRVHNGI